MVHKLSRLSLLLVLFLALFASPTLCARARLGLFHFHHSHPHLHQLHSSKTHTDANNIIVNIQMVTGREDKSSSERNTLMWAPGRMAITHKMDASGDGSITAIGVPEEEADSMKIINIPRSSDKPNPIANRRSLLDSDPALHGGQDQNLLLASFTMQKDNNLFGMLPRAHRVPPSGPSKSHNSMLTDKPS